MAQDKKQKQKRPTKAETSKPLRKDKKELSENELEQVSGGVAGNKETMDKWDK
jgi:bacteriocin-like protein